MGGRGSTSGMTANTREGSPLAAFTENARQFNEAQRQALEGNYYSVEFTDINGTVLKYYSQGNGKYGPTENSMESAFSSRKGTLKVEFNPDKLDAANKAKWNTGYQERTVNAIIDRAVEFGGNKEGIIEAAKHDLNISSSKATALVNKALKQRKANK